jgi:translation initiation factor IF-2
LIEDIDKALKGLLEPEYGQVVIGKAEVRAVFRIRRVGLIAGCYIQDGEARRNVKARVWRGDQIVYDGDVGSLRRFEEDVKEVRAGFECGASMQNWDAWEEGDIIEFYRLERIN